MKKVESFEQIGSELDGHQKGPMQSAVGPPYGKQASLQDYLVCPSNADGEDDVVRFKCARP